MFIASETSNIHRTEISDAELRSLAPSVFAAQAMPGTSARYTFLPTDQIVTAMRQEGWKPTEAREMRPRMEARRGFQRHMIRFQRRDEIAEKGEYTPEVVLINSHDRSSGYQIHAGLFRFICSNGMMVSDGLIPSIHVRHTGQEIGQIITASFQILDQLPKLADRVARFKSIGLSADIQRQFAERALALRYDRPELAPINATQLLEARRSEDAGPTLWETVNKVSENLLRGGMRDTSRVNRAGKPFRPMRPIRGLGANVGINLGIWGLAESYILN
jgi:hypothetical protein